MLLKTIALLLFISFSARAEEINYLFPELFSFEPTSQKPAEANLLPNRVYRVMIKNDKIKRFALTDSQGKFPNPFKILRKGSTIPGYLLGAKKFDQHYWLSPKGIWQPKDYEAIFIYEVFTSPPVLQAIYYPLEVEKKSPAGKKQRLITSAIPTKIRKAHYKICSFESSQCTTEAMPPLKSNSLYLVTYEGEKGESLQLTDDYGNFASPEEFLLKDSLIPGSWLGDKTPRSMYLILDDNHWIKSPERIEKQTFQIQSTPPRLKIISYSTQFGKR